MNILDRDPDPYSNLSRVDVVHEESPALSLADETKPPGMGKECLSHLATLNVSVRSQDHGFELSGDMFSGPSKDVLQKRTLSK